MTVAEGRSALIHAPRIYLDSIYGFGEDGKQVWLALEDVRQLEAQRPSAVRTGLLLAAIGTSVVIAGIALSGGGESRPEPMPNVPDLGHRVP